MQQTTLQYLSDLVATQEVPVFPTRKEYLKSFVLRKTPLVIEIEEVYKTLGGKEDCWKIEFELPDGIETEQVRVSLDGPLHFNRYRTATLNSTLYQKYQPAWLELYRRNCHSLERECLKDGVRQGIWTNQEGGRHFGEAQEAGDFYGNGSPGWKLEAFKQFLADAYLFQNTQKHKRISLFDRLMIQGKLLPLQQLLLSRTDSSRQYLVKYLSRQLEIPAQEQNA